MKYIVADIGSRNRLFRSGIRYGGPNLFVADTKSSLFVTVRLTKSECTPQLCPKGHVYLEVTCKLCICFYDLQICTNIYVFSSVS